MNRETRLTSQRGTTAGRVIRVGVDTTAIRRTRTGVETYICRLVEHLAPRSDLQLFVFANLQDAGAMRRDLPDSVRILATAFRWRPSRTVSHQVLLPVWARLLDLDVLHSTAFLLSFACPCAQVLTVHDMAFYTLPPPLCPPVDPLFRRLVLAGMRRADRIIVPSHTSLGAARRIVPGISEDRFRVIPDGVTGSAAPCAPERVAAVRRRFGIADDYILYLGTLEPRKNLPHLVRAYAAAVTAHGCCADLVLAGSVGWHPAPLERALRALPSGARVHRTGYVSEEDAAALYTGARVFVYPSIEEGFGLPPLEAMAHGTPVISSNSSAMAEVLSGAAILVDPRDETALSGAILHVLNDRNRARELRRAGFNRATEFTWERTAAETNACYREVVGSRRDKR